jgi:hypothetical protein
MMAVDTAHARAAHGRARALTQSIENCLSPGPIPSRTSSPRPGEVGYGRSADRLLRLTGEWPRGWPPVRLPRPEPAIERLGHRPSCFAGRRRTRDRPSTNGRSLQSRALLRSLRRDRCAARPGAAIAWPSERCCCPFDTEFGHLSITSTSPGRPVSVDGATQVVTRNAARLLASTGCAGTVEVGKAADLLSWS